MKNPFADFTEAERYHKFRPRYHHIPFLEVYKNLQQSFKKTLDVACGTGHSTESLSKISEKVIGCDSSEQMLAEARKNSKLDYINADACSLPFSENEFDLVNVSMGYHWLEQEEFLAEAKRVLKPNSHLTIDIFGFSGVLSSNDEKQSAHTNFMRQELARASQRQSLPTIEQQNHFQLQLLNKFDFENEIIMSAEDFIGFVSTWSNFLVKSNEEQCSCLEKMQILYDLIFAGQPLKLLFKGTSCLFQVNT